MTHYISVRPDGAGWAVEGGPSPERRTFSSGAVAEAAARHLAETLAARGEPAEIRIHLRDGRLGARLAGPSREVLWA